MRVLIFLAASFLFHLLLINLGGDVSLSPADAGRVDSLSVAVVKRSSFAPASQPAPLVKKAVKPRTFRPEKDKELLKRNSVVKRAESPPVVDPEPVVVPEPPVLVDVPSSPPPSLAQSVDIDDPLSVERVVAVDPAPSASDLAVDVVEEKTFYEEETDSDSTEIAVGEKPDFLSSVVEGAAVTIPVGSQSAFPRYDINPRPKYPRVARSRGWEGVVMFDVLVLADGRVGKIEMLSSSGYRSLDRAARSAIRRWFFAPATKMGVPTVGRVKVPIIFSLNGL